jgi:CelD/BcsL family acetyltransferase involved in cellulose biosynthesis
VDTLGPQEIPQASSFSDRLLSHAFRGTDRQKPLRLTVETITDLARFERLRRDWELLLDESNQRVYFLRHHWNLLWWAYYRPTGSRLNVLTCRAEDGRLLGAAPFYWRQRRVLGVPCVRELLFLGMGIDLKTSEQLDIIAWQGHECAVASAIAEHLKNAQDWDWLTLTQVPATSTVLPQFAQGMQEHRNQCCTTVCDRAPHIDTSVSWEQFKGSLGRSMRRNVEYYARRLFKKYDCEFSRVRSLSDLDLAFDSLVLLHQKRWLSKGEPGAFSGTSFAVFLRCAVKQGFVEGRVRVWILKINGTIEAVLVGFLDGGTLHYFQKGFNPQYAPDDLGTAMLGLCVRDCFEDRGVSTFDFMGGGAPYKDLWARSARETMALEVRRHGPRTWLVETHGRLKEWCRTLLRSVIPHRLRVARREWIRQTLLRRSIKHISVLLAIDGPSGYLSASALEPLISLF